MAQREFSDTGKSLVKEDLQDKKAELESVLKRCGRAMIAFSGGVDSSFLLACASRVLGPENVTAFTGDSETLARSELVAAREFARRTGVRHLVVETLEILDENFASNPPDRCFYCKNELFRRMKEVASDHENPCLLDGTNADDLCGHRPGARAAAGHGVRSPLAEAGLAKDDIRALSREMGLPTWDKAAMACLASRIPYGTGITPEDLQMVERAEGHLKSLGFRNVRVRLYNGMARIEVDRDLITQLLSEDLVAELKKMGFRYITADLEGFRSGSMNEP